MEYEANRYNCDRKHRKNNISKGILLNLVDKKQTTTTKNTPIYFSTNYHTEMKLVPIIMDYGLLQFDSLKFF